MKLKIYLCLYCGESNLVECLECRHCHRLNKAPRMPQIMAISEKAAMKVGLLEQTRTQDERIASLD